MAELQFRANAKQKDALRILYDDVHSSVGFGGGAGPGKTILGCFWVWSQCISYPGVSYFFGRDTLKNLKATTLESYYKFCSIYNIPPEQQGRFNDQTSKIKFDNGSEIPLLELKYYPSDPLVTSLGSLELTGGFVEESAEVDPRVLDILYSRIGRRHNDTYGIKAKILEAFNPAKNHVNTRFYKPWREGTLKPGVAFIRALVIDWLTFPEYFLETHTLHPDEPKGWWIEYILNLLQRSEQTKQRLLFGNFEYDDDKAALLTFDSIRDCFTNIHVPFNRKRYITADIAMQGSDVFRIGVWDGWVLIAQFSMAKSNGKEVLDKINEVKRIYSVPNSHITYDADGVGNFLGSKNGIGGFLPGAKPFVNNSTPREVAGKKQYYKNLKSQCYYRLAERINSRNLWLKAIEESNDPILKEWTIEELEQIKAHNMDKEGKLQIIPKEIVQANIGRSPDISDMLMMRELFELTPEFASPTAMNW